MDFYSRRIVGWADGCRLTADLVLAALTKAVARRRPPTGLLLHSDRGVQYGSGIDDFTPAEFEQLHGQKEAREHTS